jgi:predicted phage-related endonuclease
MQKRQVPPDYESPENKLFARGHKLEALVADEYAEATGRELTEMPMQRHKEHPELMVHIDRGITAPERPEPGVLEIKTVNSQMFYKIKREGLPHGYVAQLQHAMAVTGAKWGSWALLWADGWELRYWDVEPDPELQAMLVEASVKFWVTVQKGPMPAALEASDPRCARCPWRTSCQGEALKAACKDSVDGGFDPSLGALAEEYFEAKEMRDEADSLFEGTQERLKVALGNRTSTETIGARIFWRQQISMRYDTAALNKIPGMEKYKKPSVSRPLRVFAL